MGKNIIKNTDDDALLSMAQAVHECFKAGRLTLAVAESCTGGLICHYLTALPGAGQFFEAGIVSYSAESKKRLLGVSTEVIEKHGVISMETAREMAERIIFLTKADFSLSTTGNLGPDVLEGKEKGLVYIAAACRNQRTLSAQIRMPGSRMENKRQASLKAMAFLLEVVKGVGL